MPKECNRCGLYRTVTHPCIQGRGELSYKTSLFLIGEAPGCEEDERGRVFIGRAGKLLDASLESISATENVYITNAVKCLPKPPDGRGWRTPTEPEISACNGLLANEIEKCDPTYVIIIPMGNTAISALFGASHEKVTKIIGHVCHIMLDGKEYTVIPNFHPAYILRNMQKLDVFKGILAFGSTYRIFSQT